MLYPFADNASRSVKFYAAAGSARADSVPMSSVYSGFIYKRFVFIYVIYIT